MEVVILGHVVRLTSPRDAASAIQATRPLKGNHKNIRDTGDLDEYTSEAELTLG